MAGQRSGHHAQLVDCGQGRYGCDRHREFRDDGRSFRGGDAVEVEAWDGDRKIGDGARRRGIVNVWDFERRFGVEQIAMRPH
jgi:hypothetical protein